MQVGDGGGDAAPERRLERSLRTVGLLAGTESVAEHLRAGLIGEGDIRAAALAGSGLYQLFGRFTDGTYAELLVDVDDKGVGYPVARRNDRVRHTMTQMSKGTREQVLLALRIAAIERYVDIAEPIPVIFDDVFIESDDARSA